MSDLLDAEHLAHSVHRVVRGDPLRLVDEQQSVVHLTSGYDEGCERRSGSGGGGGGVDLDEGLDEGAARLPRWSPSPSSRPRDGVRLPRTPRRSPQRSVSPRERIETLNPPAFCSLSTAATSVSRAMRITSIRSSVSWIGDLGVVQILPGRVGPHEIGLWDVLNTTEHHGEQAQVSDASIRVERLCEPGVIERALAQVRRDPQHLRRSRLVLEATGVGDEPRVQTGCGRRRRARRPSAGSAVHHLCGCRRVTVDQVDRAEPRVRPVMIDHDRGLGLVHEVYETVEPPEVRRVERDQDLRRLRELARGERAARGRGAPPPSAAGPRTCSAPRRRPSRHAPRGGSRGRASSRSRPRRGSRDRRA